jgi:threonine/homoserine/homoserine lactone efflux protein
LTVAADLKDLIVVSLSWWLVSLSGVMMPGPVSAMAITEGARRGIMAGPLITAFMYSGVRYLVAPPR